MLPRTCFQLCVCVCVCVQVGGGGSTDKTEFTFVRFAVGRETNVSNCVKKGASEMANEQMHVLCHRQTENTVIR